MHDFYDFYDLIYAYSSYLFRSESKSKVNEGKCSSNDVDFGSQGVR